MRLLTAALITLATSSALAGWTGSVTPEGSLLPGRVLVAYSPDKSEGSETLDETLSALAKAGQVRKLEGITLHWLVDDPGFQAELLSALQEQAPKELATAQQSAGNMHNPAMVALREPFARAVLSTPTVARLNVSLAKYGLRVSGVEQEKLSFMSHRGRQILTSFLWLKVQPLESSLRPNNSSKPKPLRGSA